MAITGAFIMGHLSISIPELGHPMGELCPQCTRESDEIARMVEGLRPDTIILTTPHNVRYSDYFHVSPGKNARGELSGVNGHVIPFHVNYDEDFVRELIHAATAEGLTIGTDYEIKPELDHATTVPLKFINDRYTDYRLVRICLSGLPFEDHYRLGQIINRVADASGKNVVFIASGDLSHRVKDTSPYSYADEGVEFDRRVTEVMASKNFLDFMTFDLDFLETAAECGLRSFIIMAGALDGKDVEGGLHAYEPTYGVGVAEASYILGGENPQRRFLEQYRAVKARDTRVIPLDTDPYAMLAKYVVETTLEKGSPATMPRFLPTHMLNSRGGLFLSAYKGGELRARVGTLAGEQGNLAEEIYHSALLLIRRAPGVMPIERQELGDLRYVVDVCAENGTGTPIQGVVVEAGFRQGLALPDAAGRADEDSMVAQARRDAGIPEDASVTVKKVAFRRHVQQ